MKRTLYILSLIICFHSMSMRAGNVDTIIQRVLESSLTLKKQRAQTDAAKAENNTGLTLSDPEIGVNFLKGSPRNIENRRDLSISQRFDYATVFGLKRKEARKKDELAEVEYEQERLLFMKDILTYLADIAAANEKERVLQERLTSAEKIASLMRKKMEHGEANKIELNNAMLSVATVKADISGNALERLQLMSAAAFSQVLDDEMKSMLCNVSMDEITQYITTMPAYNLARLEIMKAKKENDVALAELRTVRAQSLPELTAGYMAELSPSEKVHGVTVGLSIPLWNNRGNIAKAKQQINALKAEHEEAIGAITAQKNALITRMGSLEQIRKDLTEARNNVSSDDLMKKALEAGEVPVTEYLKNRDTYYDITERIINVSHDYVITLTELSLIKN